MSITKQINFFCSVSFLVRCKFRTRIQLPPCYTALLRKRRLGFLADPIGPLLSKLGPAEFLPVDFLLSSVMDAVISYDLERGLRYGLSKHCTIHIDTT